jgi:NitT/TauT family transport system substrate-binding protein
MWTTQTRRSFIAAAAATGAAGLLGGRSAFADEGPPEVTSVRLAYDPNICIAPFYIAGELLRTEGFAEVRYVPVRPDVSQLALGEVDFDIGTGPWLLTHMDAGEPMTVLAGLHAGCYELFANEPIRTIRDLRGRRVGVQELGSAGHLYLAIMLRHVGLNPHDDIDWVTSITGNFLELLDSGKIDAFLAFPPEPQELRARGIGRMILSLTLEKPWSQYFCCMVVGHPTLIRDRPMATKRFLRAILKAADLCATEPMTAAQRLVDGKFTSRYDYTVQALSELPYRAWRDYDPEDSLRFYGLRLHEVGMLKSDPQQLIAAGTDWRFLDEIKRELKV